MMVDIFIYREVSDRKIIVWTVDTEKNTVTEKEFEDMFMLIPASFILPRNMLEPLLEALIKKWVKPTAQSFIEWKLEATESHLSDMRQLLKLWKTTKKN